MGAVLEGSSLLMDEESLRDAVRTAQEALGRAVAALETTDTHDDLASGAARLFRDRRKRDALFPPGLFVEAEWDVMLVLAQRESVRQSDLFSAVKVAPTTGARVLERLALAGLIDRSTDERVARSNLVSLSAEGRGRLKHVVGAQ
jgi:DNA-binding MarR family transcriptional regulator